MVLLSDSTWNISFVTRVPSLDVGVKVRADGAGASADSYYLAGETASQVVAGSGKLNLTQLSAAKTSTGAMQATFAMFLAQNVSSTSQINVM